MAVINEFRRGRWRGAAMGGMLPKWGMGLLAVLMLPSALFAQSFQELYPKASWPDDLKIRGAVLVGGGGELDGAVYDRFVELAGGEEAKLALIPVSRESAGAAAMNKLEETFTSRGVSTVTALGGGSAEAFAAALEAATGVWIAGAETNELIESIGGRELEAALRAVIDRGGVVGANGAGSQALTRVSITGGDTHAAVGQGFDIFPGSIIDVRFGEEGRRDRLRSAIASHPGAVGVGIDEGAALVLQGRRLSTIGGAATLMLEGNESKPDRIKRIRPRPPRTATPADNAGGRRRGANQGARGGQRRGQGKRGQRGGRGARGQRGGQGGRGQRRGRGARGGGQRRGGGGGRETTADLTAWRRDAIDRTLPMFPAENPDPPFVENGTLIIVGGGGMPPGLWDKFIELAGGPEAKMIYIPASEADEVSPNQGTINRFNRAGVASAHVIHTKDRVKADTDEEFLAPLRDATGIWFGGGRQWNIADSYYGTTAHELMLDVLARGGVIGGSSAGASIQGRYMARGDPLGNQNIMAPGYERGLGFISGVAIDQHFSQRNRLPNMTGLVDTYPQLLGIGLDEATAIIVQGSIAEVVGRGNAHFYDRNRPVVAGEPDYIALPEGGRFDLKERKVLSGSADK